MDELVEALRGVVHHLIGAELARKSSMARRGSPDGMHPRPVRQLDGKTPNAAGGAMNQDPLPGGQLGMLEERLPCGEARDGDLCRLHIIEGARLGRELV